MEINIRSKILTAEQLKNALENSNENMYTLEIKKEQKIYRNVDPSIYVAVASTVGIGIGALITGLLQIAKQKSANRIIIQDKDGNKIEVPVGISTEEVSHAVELINNLKTDKIEIQLP